MRVQILFKNGAIKVVDLGDVPDIIRLDNQAMFDYMLLIFQGKGIDVNEIAMILPEEYEIEKIN